MEAEPEGGLRRGWQQGERGPCGGRDGERDRDREMQREREKQRQKETDRQGNRERRAQTEQRERSYYNEAEWTDGVKGSVHLKGKATTDSVWRPDPASGQPLSPLCLGVILAKPTPPALWLRPGRNAKMLLPILTAPPPNCGYCSFLGAGGGGRGGAGEAVPRTPLLGSP